MSHRPGLRRLLSISLVLAAAACTMPAPTATGRSIAAGRSANDQHPTGRDTMAAHTSKAQTLVAQLTLDEKILQVHGTQVPYLYRSVPGIERLGIPPLLVTNGPAGVGVGVITPQATALPAPIALAASFDTAMANSYGIIEGKELVATGRNLLEAPTINIARTPQSGRTFEGYGEDPYLAGQLAVANIRGIQSQGVMANVKHYMGNNQETGRLSANNVIDERAMYEIYLPAFEAAVKDGYVDSVMCAYPRINGTFACENGELLNGILRRDWGFDGFVTSDFGAVHSTVPSVDAGLDVEMPTGKYFDAELRNAVQAGTVSIATIDKMLVRRYAKMMKAGVFDRAITTTPIPAYSHGQVSRQIAEAGTVLLKNSGALLPLSATDLTSIAVIGPAAGTAQTGGGGTAWVNPLYSILPMDGIRNRVGKGVAVNYHDGASSTAAAALAKAADVAIVMVGAGEAEGTDRTGLALAGNQDELISAVATANPRTVVVVKSGGPVLMPWASSVPAIVEAWYPGEEDGNVVAAVLFGDVNPSGRLPVTFPVAAGDLPANTVAQYPGVKDRYGRYTTHYTEGVFIGYRHYDRAGVAPLFPFGHGLSYTSFAYSNLKITSKPDRRVLVEADVTNTGTRAGAEVVQLYVGCPSSPEVPQPPAQLKGIAKVQLDPGATKRVTLTLDDRSFSYWDVVKHGWAIAPGDYRITLGSSSRDARLQSSVRR